MRRRHSTKAVLTGVTAASLIVLAGVLEQVDDTPLMDVVTLIMAGVALALLSSTRINAAWLIATGIVIGVVHALIT